LPRLGSRVRVPFLAQFTENPDRSRDFSFQAWMVELVDTPDLKSCGHLLVRVQVPLQVQNQCGCEREREAYHTDFPSKLKLLLFFYPNKVTLNLIQGLLTHLTIITRHSRLDPESDGAWASRTPIRFEMPNQVRHDASIRSAEQDNDWKKVETLPCPSERSEETNRPKKDASLHTAGQGGESENAETLRNRLDLQLKIYDLQLRKSAPRFSAKASPSPPPAAARRCRRGR
jgi:hypothetical protein